MYYADKTILRISSVESRDIDVLLTSWNEDLLYDLAGQLIKEIDKIKIRETSYVPIKMTQTGRPDKRTPEYKKYIEPWLTDIVSAIHDFYTKKPIEESKEAEPQGKIDMG